MHRTDSRRGISYRRYPQWIKAILIRKVEDIASIGIEAKNEPERFEKAFQGVPPDVWHVFSEPETCRKVVEGVVSAHSLASNHEDDRLV